MKEKQKTKAQKCLPSRINDKSVNIKMRKDGDLMCCIPFRHFWTKQWNLSPSRGYITASKTSTQLNCKLKHPLGDSSRGAHHFAAGIVCFLYVCLCVSVWVLILLMCCGLHSEYNCSARCHLISSSWPADTPASLKWFYRPQLQNNSVITSLDFKLLR